LNERVLNCKGTLLKANEKVHWEFK
jgi:hypothetical protein